MCTYSPESQMYAGLHQKKCDQQVQEGDSTPDAALMGAVLGRPTSKGHGPAGVGPEKATQTMRGMEHFY